MGALKIVVMNILLLTLINSQLLNGTNDEIDEKSAVLSRKKRFIIFPEGSSFQIVFCLTFAPIFTIGDIFLWGYTSALAYELPQNPYSPFDHHADPLHRREDTKTIYFTNEKGRVIFSKPYKRQPIVNPAFAKRSVDSAQGFQKGTSKYEIDRKQMHGSKHKREFLKSEHMDGWSVEFHRSSRAKLYQKIETMFQAHGNNGKHCILKTLCLIGQRENDHQGTFVQEIIRAVFTLPKHKDSNILPEYDEAFASKESCGTLYPECETTSPEMYTYVPQ